MLLGRGWDRSTFAASLNCAVRRQLTRGSCNARDKRGCSGRGCKAEGMQAGELLLEGASRHKE